jgi:hypothetical protein
VPFDVFADGILKLNGTYDRVVELDGNLNKLTAGPVGLIGGIQDLLGIDSGDNSENKGFVETQIYPGIRNTLSGSMRAGALIGGSLGLVVNLYLSYTIAGAAEINKLRKQQEQLLMRIDSLENRLAGRV